VYSVEEAQIAWESRTEDSEIMIMGAIGTGDLGWAVERDVSFYVFELTRLEAGVAAAKLLRKKARIHLELETGMNRTGLEPEELRQAVEIIKRNSDHIEIAGVCTHFAGAESISNYVRVRRQIDIFKKECEYLSAQGLYTGLRHTASSAATLLYPETRMDMVRVGIAQYGFWPSKETEMHFCLEHQKQSAKKWADPLKRVMKWKSWVMNVKEVPAGSFVGYGTSYLTTRDQKIASVPVGYFHGFHRNLSNRGYVLIHGRRCQVVGLVNMNMMMVDVTDANNTQVGDEVVIIGSQKKRSIAVGSFSDMTRFLNYEILVQLPSEIPRIRVR
jgi:alanine racemase